MSLITWKEQGERDEERTPRGGIAAQYMWEPLVVNIY